MIGLYFNSINHGLYLHSIKKKIFIKNFEDFMISILKIIDYNGKVSEDPISFILQMN